MPRAQNRSLQITQAEVPMASSTSRPRRVAASTTTGQPKIPPTKQLAPATGSAAQPIAIQKSIPAKSPKSSRTGRIAEVEDKSKSIVAATKSPLPTPLSAAVPVPPQGKIELVAHLIQRPSGASLPELMVATGWQAHSVRGVISGVLRRKHGMTISLIHAVDGTRRYQVSA
jgi:hypothetical protein